MLQVVDLLKEVNAVDRLYVYQKVGILNSHVLSVVQVANLLWIFMCMRNPMNCSMS